MAVFRKDPTSAADVGTTHKHTLNFRVYRVQGSGFPGLHPSP